MPTAKRAAEKFLKKIVEQFDCEVMIFLAKRLGLAEQWVKKNNLKVFSLYVKNKREYRYLILDNRCELIDAVFELFDKLLLDFVVVETQKNYCVKS